MLRHASLLLLSSVALASCGQSLSSTHVNSLSATDKHWGRAQGETYYLPRSIVRARLSATAESGLKVTIDQPVIVPDNAAVFVDLAPEARDVCARNSDNLPPRHFAGPYTLSHRVSGFHQDDITVEVSNGLLKSITSDTKEKTTEALSNAAKSAGTIFGLEAGAAKDPGDLWEATFDPASCEEVYSVTEHLRGAIATLGISKLRELIAQDSSGPLKNLAVGAIDLPSVYIRVLGFRPFRLPGNAAANPADCRVGVCVPVSAPAIISVGAGNRNAQSSMLSLPNGSDPVAIPLARSAFTDVKTVLTLDNGVLTKRQVVRGSEAAAIALLPATLVGGYLDAITGISSKQKAAIEGRLALLEAENKARLKEKELETGKTEASMAPPTDRGAPLLELFLPGLSVEPAAPKTGTPQAIRNTTTLPSQDQGLVTPSEDGQPSAPSGNGGKKKQINGESQ